MSRSSKPSESPLMAALRQFEAAEANLVKLERTWKKISSDLPNGPVFGTPPAFEERVRVYLDILRYLPPIEGWKPTTEPMSIDAVGQAHFDALELGEPGAGAAVDEAARIPGQELAEYRFRFNKERRGLIRAAVQEVVAFAEQEVGRIRRATRAKRPRKTWTTAGTRLSELISQIDTLLGSSVKRPERWSDLRRHLAFSERHDFVDIVERDWPAVRDGLQKSVFHSDEPIPVDVADLGLLTKSRPAGPVAKKLRWRNLNAEDFERLIFALVSTTTGYENAQWLTATNAPDRGRDLSVLRVARDALTGSIRSRAIIQCKHWLRRSVAAKDISILKDQVKLWEPPRVDVVVIATSGRFSADAISLVERHNLSDSGLRIEMWPESHLEALLASQPSFIAEFGLRG